MTKAEWQSRAELDLNSFKAGYGFVSWQNEAEHSRDPNPPVLMHLLLRVMGLCMVRYSIWMQNSEKKGAEVHLNGP